MGIGLKAIEIDGSDGDQFDLISETGVWLGWVSRTGRNMDTGDEGVLTLMSTGAPLEQWERTALAARASTVLCERVATERS